MTREELQALADRYQRIADRAYQNYQESRIGRYDTKYRDNERLANALRMAAEAAEDHQMMVHYKGELTDLAYKAGRIKYSDSETAEKLREEIVSDLLVYGRANGVKTCESNS